MVGRSAAAALAVLLAGVAGAAEDASSCEPSQDACSVPPSGWPRRAPASPAATPPAPATLVVFWREGCPRCEEARPFVAELAAEAPGVAVEWVEVRAGGEGRERFQATVERLGIAGAGVPLFATARGAVVGFRRGTSEIEIRRLAGLAPDGGGAAVSLPWIGAVDARRLPLAAFTALVGLLDGFNPCAMYVLGVLLGILLHAGSRRRVALYGGTFVAVSGVVYVLFMSAWLQLFSLGGMSRALTAALGAALAGMGLLNLKDAVWLGRGPSLSVPDRAKPGLFRRMRAVASAASLPAGLAGVAALAFVVNLVELGCTLGLPAMYTRVLASRADLGPLGRAAYLSLYGLFYVVPLGAVVGTFALTFRRAVLTERRARALKALSGALLLAAGLLFLLRPGVLG